MAPMMLKEKNKSITENTGRDNMKLAGSRCALQLCCRQHHLESFFSRNEIILGVLITKITKCGKLHTYYFLPFLSADEKKQHKNID